MEQKLTINGIDMRCRITGEGEPVAQIHGAGFAHFNFDPVTPELAKHFTVIDFDLRGFGQSDRPLQHYDMEVWADDVAALLDALQIEAAHIHGSSMGGMIAIVFAGKYPDRTRSVVINCAAARLGTAGRLLVKNWRDIVRLDPDGMGSRLLAELYVWEGFSKTFLAKEDTDEVIERTRTILRDSNSVDVYTTACQAMIDMDLRAWLPRIKAPALVLGGEADIMTPWDQGPDGDGQEAIFRGLALGEKNVIRGANHGTIFDATDEHLRTVVSFFRRHS